MAEGGGVMAGDLETGSAVTQATTAQVSGTADIGERGIMLMVYPGDPSAGGEAIPVGGSSGDFVLSLSGLQEHTKYTYCTYFGEEGDREYGDILVFETKHGDEVPYTAAMKGLWGLLEKDSRFTTTVPPGSRIKMIDMDSEESPERPILDEIANANVPEVRLILKTSNPHPSNTSSSHLDTVYFEFQCASGDQRFDKMHNRLRFIFLRAMCEACDWLRENVFWVDDEGGNHAILKLVKPGVVQDGVSNRDLNRGIIGWSALWGVSVEMWFKKELL